VTPLSLRSIVGRIVRFPLTRIVIATVVVIAAASAPGPLWSYFTGNPDFADGQGGLGFSVIATAAVILAVDLAYRGYVRLVERRPADELGLRGALAELGWGAALGAALIAATIGTLWEVGDYQVEAINGWRAPAGVLVLAILSGYTEEIVARGILFRITEEALGTWLALALSAALFGFAHALNPNATFVSSAMIGLEAGVLLGIGFVLTRRLWFAIGLHAAWNFAEGGLFGVPVSGYKLEGLLRGELSGSPALTGGAFGPEASVVALAVCSAAAVVLAIIAVRRGHVKRPFWAWRWQ
jgi:membrane protease YdiL (CAAX protease family)